ncbi:MAG: hypothetical protein ACRELY_31025 [Polyangiaceae bacterium]
MLFGLRLDMVSPWDGSAFPAPRPLPKVELVDPYDGRPIELAPSHQLELDATSPWADQVTDPADGDPSP